MKGDVKDIFSPPRDGAVFLLRDSQPFLVTTTPLVLH